MSTLLLNTEPLDCAEQLDYTEEHPSVIDRIDLLQESLETLTVSLQQQARQNKLTFLELKKMVDIVETDNITLKHKLHEQSEENFLKQAHRENKLLNASLLHTIDLYDRLSIALRYSQDYVQNMGWWNRWRLGPILPHLHSVLEGQQMTLDRVLAVLEQQGVSRIASLNQPYDAHIMEAIATEADPLQLDNLVLKDVQAGFMRKNGDIIRLAKVIINHRQHNLP
jgi:molecular chaperone GrpE (heat shock protein)